MAVKDLRIRRIARIFDLVLRCRFIQLKRKTAYKESSNFFLSNMSRLHEMHRGILSIRIAKIGK